MESYRSQDAATMAAVQPHYSHETCRINVTVIYERRSPVLNNILTPLLSSIPPKLSDNFPNRFKLFERSGEKLRKIKLG